MLIHCEFLLLHILIHIIDFFVNLHFVIIHQSDHLTTVHEISIPQSGENKALGEKELS